ncbi:hypothetical protein F5X99DRAFT_63854 [Biscogniauxia marginata]|nr:hypothetical protein F5X99DRAFT_63854 [Biscogniauxia marginata]
MSLHNTSLTDHSDTVSGSLEPDERFDDDQHYTSNFTRNRPPHLNDSNFPSTQINGIMTDPSHVANDGLAANRGNIYNPQRYAPSPQSATDGTNAAAMGVRNYLQYFINQNYDGTIQPLTEQAVDALNHCHRLGSHAGGGGNISEWVNGGVFAAAEAGGPASAIGASISMLRDGPRSRLTMTTTGSSRSMGSAARHSHLDCIAENVCAAGWQFDDMPAYPARLDIGDEDIA